MTNSDPERVRRLGIMGGSFDPIHLAHLLVGETVCEALHLDRVLYLPAGEQPLKRGRPVTPPEHRVRMVELAIEGNPYFALSRVDVDRPGPSYTAQTLEILRKEYGGPDEVAMWFIVGGDSLATFPYWREPERILAQCRLAVVRRPGVLFEKPILDSALPQLEGYLDWIQAPLVDISATDLRNRSAEGRSLRYRVPDRVREYIEEHKLYTYSGK